MVTYTNDIRLSAPIPSLDLPKDATLQEALEALAALANSHEDLLQKEIYPVASSMSTDDIKYTGDAFSAKGLSPMAQQFEGTKLKIETVRTDQNVELKFKSTDFNIPEDSTIASSVVHISGSVSMGRSEILNTKEPGMNVNIGYARFPVTLDARVVVTTPDGDVELKKTMTISSEEELNQEIPYDIVDRIPQKKPTNLTEVFDQLGNRLKAAEKKKLNG